MAGIGGEKRLVRSESAAAPAMGIASNEHGGDGATICRQRLRARLRRHRVERLGSPRSRRGLAEDQETGGASSHARGRGGVELAGATSRPIRSGSLRGPR